MNHWKEFFKKALELASIAKARECRFYLAQIMLRAGERFKIAQDTWNEMLKFGFVSEDGEVLRDADKLSCCFSGGV